MFKKFITIFALLLLNNCATSGSALLGPIFTGAKTGSIYQASISYSTGKLMNEFVSSEIFYQKDEQMDPIIISSYKVENISFSEVYEEEPLP
tara:strand:+ start:194 stop:469 length:276 start_codon:yes stop_codon:yes gene_type:complete